ncbi:hypothetical protein A3D42_00520 [Candidatus Nomurabacteria bacterium RIFCSPHIGHO2_02_FULL_41_18]|uniref:TrbC/VIRB2 family protein n=1 Tax=Candidatus Nomurabacteria bacterium RIFCSPHIGHO2_02_FULL_41_18 TaxID=1801754 RepID=A0A1F6W7U6_9BACT|nr:MAG: hypothetical protein A3D42_00520 [Candidatus Nomurabacteria bacterium RIFCSPHIGHO2_02_FULL_41_18]
MNLKRNLGGLLLAIFVFFLPLVSFSADIDGKPCNKSGIICNPISVDNVQDFIRVLLEGVLRIGMPIVALAVIYSGFLFVTAVGNTEKIKKARETLMYTLIGAAILLGSWAIAQLISETVRGLSV